MQRKGHKEIPLGTTRLFKRDGSSIKHTKNGYELYIPSSIGISGVSATYARLGDALKVRQQVMSW